MNHDHHADSKSRASAEDEQESRLAEVINSCVVRLQAGQPVDLEEVLAQHASLAPEIRRLWATVQIAEELGSVSDRAPEFDGSTEQLKPARPVHRDVPRVVGDYEILEELGRGGMGVVYKARQKSLGRIVALKMLLQGEWASPSDKARFRQETEAAAHLNHPHIVPLYETGEFEGHPYISLQWIDGITLSHRLADGPLPARQLAELLLPVCRAVTKAHEQGLLHRDLKPSNILIDKDSRPYVTDFGLAKRFLSENDQAGGELPKTQLTFSGAIIGTPGYMAPEQAAGGRMDIGPQADVYSLGAILYAGLTGKVPFQADTPLETLRLVIEQDPVPPRMISPRCDPELELIALKCLQKPCDLRYPSASALADDLEAYLAHEPIAARSGRFAQIIGLAFRETHHAVVLENWGVLWMWHSLALLVLCLTTNRFQYLDIASRWPYLTLWVVGLGVWAGIFWRLRRRSGPITFVERQVAHVWAGSMAASTLLFGVEWLMGMPVLKLSPVLGLVSGCVFLVKAGILNGVFYFQAAALFLTALVMAALQLPDQPDLGISLFGIVSAACFFVPGWKYYRQRVRQESKRR